MIRLKQAVNLTLFTIQPRKCLLCVAAAYEAPSLIAWQDAGGKTVIALCVCVCVSVCVCGGCSIYKLCTPHDAVKHLASVE
jgi:hypothetical protein